MGRIDSYPVSATFSISASAITSEAWTDWTPTLTQGATPTKTVNYAKYMRIGRLIVAQYDLSVTSTGTAGNEVLVGLPVATAYAATNMTIGGGLIYDASTTTVYTGEWGLMSTTTIAMFLDQASPGRWGNVPNLALASGDVIRLHVTYEAVS